MEEIALLIRRAAEARAIGAEKQRAFGEVVRRFQDLAFACSYAILGDFDLAEDAAQESFIEAWRNLDALRNPAAFPGWFKRIVISQCNRLTRVRRAPTVSMELIGETAAAGADPRLAVESSELRQQVRDAIAALPEHERLVTSLFYIGDYSQNEISQFLELPITTIKKRLFSARRKLKERMLVMMRETLQERKPSRDERFVDTVAAYNEALDSFVSKVRQDRHVLAAILFGSMAYDQVWHKSDIDIMLVGRDEKRPARDFYLVENGINIHALMLPRSRFKSTLEGSLQGAFFHSAFSRSTLLFTHDESIREYYNDLQHVGDSDRAMRLLNAAGDALYTLAKAEKWFTVKKDLHYSFVWILYTVNSLAAIETILANQVTGREALQQALELNPSFFRAVYVELIDQPKSASAIERALKNINQYLEARLCVLFEPILTYLSGEGSARSTSELDGYFKKQVQTHSLAIIYEWLADKGVIQKIPYPIRLTEKSQIELNEAAYYYDGDSAK